MKKKYILNTNNIFFSFDENFCTTTIEILNSDIFLDIVQHYSKWRLKHELYLFNYKDANEFSKNFIDFCKHIYIWNFEELNSSKKFAKFTLSKNKTLKFVEDLYDFWRRLIRFSTKNNTNIDVKNHSNFIDSHSKFASLVLELYRNITQKIQGFENSIYRQTISGVNAGIILNKFSNNITKKYNFLSDIKIVENVILYPPFITYPKQNKRKGVFQKLNTNPLLDLSLESDNYLGFTIKVGKLSAIIVVHSKMVNIAIGLINIFQVIDFKDIEQTNFDLVYIFGNDASSKSGYFVDTNQVVASLPLSDEYEYFGYIKKMILTMHNVYQMEKNKLPIHGSMFKITTNKNIVKNVCLIGDSGAGKSETIEALNLLSKDYIKEISVIFDDMGVFFKKDNKIYANGTEIGAFVRLDDLDQGYPYRELDRAIFMNPDKMNSRLIIPISTIEEIINDEPIDIVLYANNYENEKLFIANDFNDVKNIFIDGKRKAKGTTEESGIVKSFFSNPFGAFQDQSKTQELVDVFFSQMENTKFGICFTKLGIEGFEQDGPKNAALEIIDYINKNFG